MLRVPSRIPRRENSTGDLPSIPESSGQVTPRLVVSHDDLQRLRQEQEQEQNRSQRMDSAEVLAPYIKVRTLVVKFLTFSYS